MSAFLQPVSAPEVMGLPGFADLRAAADALLDALRRVRRHRDVLSGTTVAAIDAVEIEIIEQVGGVLDGLAVDRGLPAQGGSVSIRGGVDYEVDDVRGCWLWQGAFSRDFPVVGRKVPGGENMAARIYFLLDGGSLGEDEVLLRRCDVRACVNPSHGEVVSRAVVVRRTSAKVSEEDVRIMRNAAAAGETQASLAARFAMSTRNVSDIIANRIWKDPDYIPGLPLEGGSISGRSRRHFTRAAGDYRLDEAGCWVWLRYAHPNGTPTLRAAGRNLSAGRVYWERANGPCPANMVVARTCGNPMCVHPAHAELARGRRQSMRHGRARALRTREAVAPVIQQARREAQVERQQRFALWWAQNRGPSLETPLGDGGTIADIAPPADVFDPFEEIRRIELRSIVGDLDEDAIACLPEAELLTLRERLLAHGYVPSTRSIKELVPA